MHGLVPDQLGAKELVAQVLLPGAACGCSVDEVAHHHARDGQHGMHAAIDTAHKIGSLHGANQQADKVQRNHDLHPVLQRLDGGQVVRPPAQRAKQRQHHVVEEDQVARNGHKRGNQALAVAKQQVFDGGVALPAHLFPALQANAQRPARFLAIGCAKGVGKELTHAQRHGDVQLLFLARPALAFDAIGHREFAKNLAHAHACQACAHVVVFGQRAGVERLVMRLGSQRQHGAARETGAHARRRHHAAHAFAHDQILGMPLGKLVHIDARHPLVPVALQRCDGQLNEVDAWQQVVEVFQLQRVQHILAVMQHHAGKFNAARLARLFDALYDPVQAVCLAGGAIMGHGHAHQLLVAAAHALHLVNRALVVGVGAHKDHEFTVFQRGHHVLDHGGDHVIFLPRRHHDGDGLFGHRAQLLGRQRLVVGPDLELAPDLAHPVAHIDEQVINTGNQHHHGNKGRGRLQKAVIGAEKIRQHLHDQTAFAARRIFTICSLASPWP